MKEINCNEAQENEIEALKAIYMDDFEIIESNVRTWKVTKKYKEFKIKIKPMSEELKDLVQVSLKIKMPPAYPIIAPEANLEESKGLSEAQFLELKKLIKKKIHTLTGSEMVFDLCDVILEFITTYNTGPEKSSFHEQMIKRQERLFKEEEELAQKEIERLALLEKEKEELENERLSKALEEEMIKKEQKMIEERIKRKLIKSEYTLGSLIEFDHPIYIYSHSILEQSLSFMSVTLGPCVAKDQYSKSYFALPYNPTSNNEFVVPPLLLEEIILFPPDENKMKAIEELRKIEETLEKLKEIRHPGLLNIYEYKVDDLDLNNISWKLLILVETKLLSCSLRNSLKKCGPLNFNLVRDYFKELLKAVQVLHFNNINYNFIRTDKIILDSEADESNNNTRQSYFDHIHSSVKFLPRNYLQFSNHLNEGSLESDSKWPPPETRYNSELTRQSDIWDLGLVLIEMLLGPKLLASYTSLTELIEASFGTFDPNIRDLVGSMLQTNPTNRPGVKLLLQHPFFKTDSISVPSIDNLCSQFANTHKVAQNIASSPDSNPSNSYQYRSMFEHFHTASKTISRYQNDFEELQFVGKGGFGEVVKAKNKLDGRIYAIKKVRLDPEDTENSRKILREVSALSRLHHQYIVRYYTAWLENADGAWDDDDSMSEESDTKSESEHSSDLEGDFLYSEQSASFGFKKSAPIRFANSRNNYSYSRESISESNSEKSDHSSLQIHRILYIQMEYCDKSTLRDVIDEGMSIDESWRVLRQILEGLDHLHSQGMIHRDLKPSNIFLASNGDVKIGDFGLATSSNNMVEGILSRKISYEVYNGSMTTDVGTSFYMSPEVLKKVARYNQKVDMYSLGIIFFEMVYPFSTGMERAFALRDLRQKAIIFPANFPDNLKNQAIIIKRLLSHDEKERPTALELLQSNLLPTRMEDEYIQECIRIIANPESPHYLKLIGTLFKQQMDRHKDLIYDHKSKNCNELSAAIHFEFIRSILIRIFKRHGAAEFDVPLLMPQTEKFSEFQKPAFLIDNSGTIVQVPYDLTLPFARFIARNEISNLKRFVFDKVFRQNTDDDTLLEVQEADFDIVSPFKDDIASEAEVIKVVDEIIDALPAGIVSDCHFQINHGLLSTIIMDACKVPKAKRNNVAIILSQLEAPKSLLHIRNLLSRCHLSKAMIEELILLYVTGDLESCHSKLRKMSLLKSHKAALDVVFDNLKKLLLYLKRLGINRKIMFNSFCMYNLHYYETGVIFRMIRDTKKGDILAVGGRYDSLVLRHRSPLLPNLPIKYAVGVSIAIQKLGFILSQYGSQRIGFKKGDEDRSTAVWTPKMLDVYITSFGKGLLEERLDIARDLWAHHIRCDFRRDNEPEFNLDTFVQNNGILGVNWIVYVKSSKKEGHTVKVRNVSTRTETEVPQTELPNYLLHEISESHRLDLAAAGITGKKKGDHSGKFFTEEEALTQSIGDSGLSLPSSGVIEDGGLACFNLSLVNSAPNKVNPKRKRQLFDRALEAVLRIARNAFKPGTPVIVIDVPKDCLKKVLDCPLLDEEAYKKILGSLSPNHRVQIQMARNVLLSGFGDSDSKSNRMAWLYSIKDDCALCYPLS